MKRGVTPIENLLDLEEQERSERDDTMSKVRTKIRNTGIHGGMRSYDEAYGMPPPPSSHRGNDRRTQLPPKNVNVSVEIEQPKQDTIIVYPDHHQQRMDPRMDPRIDPRMDPRTIYQQPYQSGMQQGMQHTMMMPNMPNFQMNQNGLSSVPTMNPYPEIKEGFISCLDIANHTTSCPICSKLYNTDKSIFVAVIVVLIIICLLLVKKLMEKN